MEAAQLQQHPIFDLFEDHEVSLPDDLLTAMHTLDDRELDLMMKQIAFNDLRPEDGDGGAGDGGEGESPSARSGPTLDGGRLLADPDAELSRYKSEGGTDLDLVAGYLVGQSFLHVVRTTSQPAMARSVMKALVPPLARQMCIEAGVEGVSAMMLAEQAAEARADEAYQRALAGSALDEGDLKKAERLEKAADRHSRRLMKAVEQLHRLRRPSVSVKIREASNVNLGSQRIVNPQVDERDCVEPVRSTQSRQDSR